MKSRRWPVSPGSGPSTAGTSVPWGKGGNSVSPKLRKTSSRCRNISHRSPNIEPSYGLSSRPRPPLSSYGGSPKLGSLRGGMPMKDRKKSWRFIASHQRSPPDGPDFEGHQLIKKQLRERPCRNFLNDAIAMMLPQMLLLQSLRSAVALSGYSGLSQWPRRPTTPQLQPQNVAASAATVTAVQRKMCKGALEVPFLTSRATGPS